jgi:hypothetical protein
MAATCDGCGRPAGPGARSHRHRLICPVCLQVAFNLGLIKNRCPEGHEFTKDNTLVSKPGYWQCRTCHRDQTRDRAAARRAREVKAQQPITTEEN